MSVDIHPRAATTPRRHRVPDVRSGRPRVVAGSLVAGAVTALVLTLVVFPGATESVITGSDAPRLRRSAGR